MRGNRVKITTKVLTILKVRLALPGFLAQETRPKDFLPSTVNKAFQFTKWDVSGRKMFLFQLTE
jgi:hypothetical protein